MLICIKKRHHFNELLHLERLYSSILAYGVLKRLQSLNWDAAYLSSLALTAQANNQSCCVYWKPSVVCTVSNVKLITSCAAESFPQRCSAMCICIWSLVEAEAGHDSYNRHCSVLKPERTVNQGIWPRNLNRFKL